HDILYVHYDMRHSISSILSRDLGSQDVKIVITLNGNFITVLVFDKLFKRMITYGIENSDAVTAVSQGLVNQTKNHLHVKKDIEVIYNFVNEADYQKKERTFLKEHYQIKPNEKVIIHISNFRK